MAVDRHFHRDRRVFGSDPVGLAQQAQRVLRPGAVRQAVRDYRQAHSLHSLIKGAALAVVAIILLLVTVKVFLRLRRYRAV